MQTSFGYPTKEVSKKPHYDFKRAGEVFDSLIDKLENPRPIEMPTGLIKLDGVIGGFRRGHLAIIAARPGGGKTALATQFGWKLAKEGKKVFYFSLEMSKEEILTRIICMETGIEHDRLYKGYGLGTDFQRVKDTKMLFDKTPFIVFDDVGYRFTDIDYVVKDFTAENKPDLVIVDHVQLVDKRSYRSPIEALEEYTRKCKEFARTTDTAWLLLSQINRDAERRTGSPRLENLKGSGALEECGDVVMIGSWDGQNGAEYKLDIAKHRHGRRAMMLIDFKPQFFRFDNILEVGAKPKYEAGYVREPDEVFA